MTSCSRRIDVKFLRLAAATDRPISRVALDVGPVRSGEPGTWASLTMGEALDLARRLMAQVCVAEAESAPVDAPASTPPRAPSA
ncbi:hypothetical protein [Streptomyces sp. NBC_00878]|uniref:hypothetical protein n=1 Tax=Streptomyces sp. NBC_00878 TaxID=2975854 RepID=UPI002254C58B|nr:hypothetical protein [Streptomyces sp. NBC_00878]MCX4906981.1 hypothetical protein [Streptomyces sp. NBC_00878]